MKICSYDVDEIETWTQLNAILAPSSFTVMSRGSPPTNFKIFKGFRIGFKNVLEFSSISTDIFFYLCPLSLKAFTSMIVTGMS